LIEYRREIDGLRAIAVLAVLFFHAGFAQASGGFVGVDVFFVISGYLITALIVAERAAGRFSLARFYERRARRILPALFCVVLACLPFAWLWMLPDQLKDFSASLVYVLAFLSNVYFAKDTGYFAAAAEEKPLLHTWSLAVEEQYYLVFPLVIAALGRWGRRGLFGGLSLFALGSLLLAQHQTGTRPDELFFHTSGRVWEFSIGALLALVPGSRTSAKVPHVVREVGAALGLAAILYAVFAFDTNTPSPGAYMLLPTLGAALALCFATPSTAVGRILVSPPLVGVGLISYSAYLWHQPLLAFARLRSMVALGAPLRLGLLFAALVLAGLSWRLVEQPFRDRRKVGRRALVWATTTTAALLLAAGLGGEAVGDYRIGRSERWSAIQRDLQQLRKEREAWIRSGECQFNAHGVHRDLDAFLAHWNCEGDPSHPELARIPVVVTGDSHAADVVMALKLNGHVPLHMGGAGCSLVPSLMSATCLREFEHLKRLIAERPFYTHIALVNHLTREELSDTAIAEMIGFWSVPGKRLVFFSARPEFTNFKRLLLSRADARADFDLADYSERPALRAALERARVEMVSTRELFCAMATDCGFLDEHGNLLLIDGHHLTRRGAERFGRALLAAGTLQALR
jgi:peptidoglycan/LPS O-acetylase OafA/YrhL